jgi:glycosyltransferase involved in cell wall biosynthesis
VQPLNLTFHGHVFTATGYGHASRAYIRALCEAGIHVSVSNINDTVDVYDPFVASLLNRLSTSELDLCHTFPQQLAGLGLPLPHVIAMIAWEAETITEAWNRILSQVKEVWVPCKHNEKVFGQCLEVPIFRLPHPYLPSPGEDEVASFEKLFNIKQNDFLFYSIFAWQDRKFPLGLIQAFLDAFGGCSDAVLLLKTHFRIIGEKVGHLVVEDLQRRFNERVSKAGPRIKISTRVWPEPFIRALAKRGNCYVSLHRGEGWCYPLFNAACDGTPVIATNYCGPTDYLDARFHNLVSYTLTAGSESFCDSDSEVLWAEPDLSDAVSLMRYVYEHREEAGARAAAGGQLLREAYSIDKVGRAAADRLKLLLE